MKLVFIMQMMKKKHTTYGSHTAKGSQKFLYCLKIVRKLTPIQQLH